LQGELFGVDGSSINEKSSQVHQLPLKPDASLECLQPSYNPVHLQKVVGEGVLLATGAIAILLQVAHPGVGAGVNENSNFAYRPADRLRTTMTFVYCMAFGTPAERAAIIEEVHRAHVPVRGADYTADDPHLQLWVASTLYVCGLDIYEKVFGPLSPDEAELVYQEYAVIGTALRVPKEMWPATRKEFWIYWDEKIATLPITDHAKNVAKDLMYNKKGPWWIRANLPFLRVLTVAWCPPRMRPEFGLKSSAPKRALYHTTIGLMKIFVPMTPKLIRQYPKKYYMKDMRTRMAKAGQV